MFVDASAIVVVLTRETEADAFSNLLERAESLCTSPVAIFEAVMGLCRKRRARIQEAERDVGSPGTELEFAL